MIVCHWACPQWLLATCSGDSSTLADKDLSVFDFLVVFVDFFFFVFVGGEVGVLFLEEGLSSSVFFLTFFFFVLLEGCDSDVMALLPPEMSGRSSEKQNRRYV